MLLNLNDTESMLARWKVWPARHNEQLCAADSTGQRNTFAESLSGRLEAGRFARPLIQLSGDRIELGLRVAGDVDAFRHVLPEQPIGV